MVGQAAVQQEQQENSSWVRCWLHHDPDLQIQQSPSSVSRLLVCWGTLTEGSKNTGPDGSLFTLVHSGRQAAHLGPEGPTGRPDPSCRLLNWFRTGFIVEDRCVSKPSVFVCRLTLWIRSSDQTSQSSPSADFCP